MLRMISFLYAILSNTSPINQNKYLVTISTLILIILISCAFIFIFIFIFIINSVYDEFYLTNLLCIIEFPFMITLCVRRLHNLNFSEKWLGAFLTTWIIFLLSVTNLLDMEFSTIYLLSNKVLPLTIPVMFVFVGLLPNSEFLKWRIKK